MLAIMPVRAPAGDASFWSQQRRGANCQNEDVGPAYWRAASEAGIEFIRLVPDAWQSASRDFLIGSADSFVTIDERDMETLIGVLDDAQRFNIKVILAMFSQPGARWIQLNDDVGDYRLWNDKAYHAQCASFWRQVAARLKDHPALLGYNPLNEPHPEKEHGIGDAYGQAAPDWFASVRETAADVNVFNRTVVSAIRDVDPGTPIILDGPFYASPGGLRFVRPIDADAVFYAIHFYGPWQYVTFRVNKGRFAYPDRMPTGEGDGTRVWTIQDLRERMAVVEEWACPNDVPREHIIASEFGVDRRVEGAAEYLGDIILVLNERGYHWAFYAYRGDGSWGGMDYELGTAKLGWEFWEAVERGEDPELYKKRGDNPLWAVIQRELQ